MNRVLFILITTFILILCYESKRSIPTKEPLFITRQKEKVESVIKDNNLSSVLFAYTVGGQKGISKSIVSSHKNLYLIHLFTPSGLHLSSLFLFLTPLLAFLKFKSFNYFFVLSFLLTLPPFFLDGFFAVKRVSFLKLLSLLFQRTKNKFSLFWIFLLAFLLDFLFGTFDGAPLSFIYSFLFLGLIFSHQKWPFIWLPFFLMLGQILIHFFLDTPFLPLNFILGFFLTSIFTFIFPIFFISFCFPGISFFSKFLLSVFLFLIKWGNFYLKHSPSIFISGELLILILIFISSLNFKKKATALIIFSIFSSPAIFNLNKIVPQRRDSFYLALDKEGIKKISRNTKGYIIEYHQGWRCSYEFSLGGINKSCQ